MFKGDIDDVRFYNYALSANEVEKLHKSVGSNIENTVTNSTTTNVRYYTLDGAMHNVPQNGINVVRTQYSDGSVTVEKIMKK